MKSKELFNIFTAGIFKENPIFVLFLGMCPALGVTTSVVNAIGMGVGVIFVLLLSNVIISLIRNIVMDEIRIPVFIVIIASLVTLLQMFMQAYTIELYNSMKVFIPLITVNCIILGRAEAFASKNGPVKSAIDGVGMGIGFMIGLFAIAFFRELLGTGAIAGFQIFPAEFAIPVFTTAVGAFLTLGILAGIAMVYSNHKKDVQEALEKAAIAAKKAEAEAKKGEVA
ncbi:electron transport complex protein RnfE [Bacilli bacterium PM5-3]|nr:electron transport complex protein RnfE [Bacilli bacterium PM5-3]MDH6603885.1 electron transport complex protein RnfE [Bacilli bacterium PM5-9]